MKFNAIVKRIIPLVFILSLLGPLPAWAQSIIKTKEINCNNPGLAAYTGLCNILGALNIIIFILEFLVIIYFMYGIAKYLKAGGDPAKVKEARNAIVWGVIGIGAIFGVNVIFNFTAGFFGIKEGLSPIPFFSK